MAEDIRVTLTIQALNVPQTREAIRSLTHAMTELRDVIRTVAPEIGRLTTGLAVLGPRALRALGLTADALGRIAVHRTTLDEFNARMNELGRVSRAIRARMTDLRSEVGFNDRAWSALITTLRRSRRATEEDVALAERARGIYRELAGVIGRTNRPLMELVNTSIRVMDVSRVSTAQFATLSEVSRELGISIEELTEGIRLTPGVIMRLTRSLEVLRGLSLASGVTIRDMARVFPQFRMELVRGLTPQRLFMLVMNQLTRVNQLSIEQQTILARILGVSRQGLLELSRSAISATEGMRRVAWGLREATGGFGRMGIAMLRVGRQLFWTGLGLMFIAMAYDRLSARQIMIHRQALQLVATQERLRLSQERLREVIEEYGPASREAQREMRRHRLLQMRTRLETMELERAVQSWALSTVMLFASAGAQVLGTTTQMAFAYGIMQARGVEHIRTALMEAGAVRERARAEMEGVGATMMGTSSKIASTGVSATRTAQLGTETGAIMTQTGAQQALNVAMITGIKLKSILLGLTTFGIVALVGWVASMALAQEQMRRINEEVRRMQRELGYLHAGRSAGLIDVIEDTTRLGRILDRVGRIARRTTVGYEVLTRTLGRPIIMRQEARIVRDERIGRRIYEEIREVREGLGIRSPGIRVELEEPLRPVVVERPIYIGPITIQGQFGTPEERRKLMRDIRREMLRSLQAGGMR